MRLQNIRIDNFRRIRKAAVELDGGANLFLGENAQGKTTVLEAVSYLATGRSFRTNRDKECLRHGKSEDDICSVEATFHRQGVEHRIRLAMTETGKTFWIDGKQIKKLGELWGLLFVVTFIPSDLGVVHGAPGERRALCDNLLARTNMMTLPTMQRYQVALKERNALFRHQVPLSSHEYEAYEQQMAEHGGRLLLARRHMVGQLSYAAGDHLRQLTGRDEHLEIFHEIGIPKNSGITLEDDSTEKGLMAALLKHWKQERAHDADRGYTRHGPHRGDLAMMLDGKDARNFASQGQSRSIVLALRLAEVTLLQKLTGEPPILLLDDVLGELDRHRTEHFTELLRGSKLQTLLTATDTAKLGSAIPIDSTFLVSDGAISAAN